MRNNKNKHKWIRVGLVALFSVLLSGSAVEAATFSAGDSYMLEKAELIDDDLYAAADTIDIYGSIGGDAFLAGNTLRVAGGIRDDAMLVAGKAAIVGDYGDDVRIAAGEMVVASSTIAGDLLVFAGVVELEEDVRVEGDLVIMADRAVVDGWVGGELRIYARQTELTATSTGDVYISASESVALKGDVAIQGTLTYKAPREALVADTATVNGETNYTAVERSGPSGEVMRLVFELVSVLLWALSAVILVFLFPRRVTSVVDTVLARQGLSVLVGLAAFGVVPFTMILLLFTGVGLPLGVLGLLLYVVALFVSHLLTPVLAGVLILSLFNKENSVSIRTTIAGAGVLFLLNLLPVLGLVITVVLALAVFGAILELVWRALRADDDVPPALREDVRATHTNETNPPEEQQSEAETSEGSSVSPESAEEHTHEEQQTNEEENGRSDK